MPTIFTHFSQSLLLLCLHYSFGIVTLLTFERESSQQLVLNKVWRRRKRRKAFKTDVALWDDYFDYDFCSLSIRLTFCMWFIARKRHMLDDNYMNDFHPCQIIHFSCQATLSFLTFSLLKTEASTQSKNAYCSFPFKIRYLAGLLSLCFRSC